MASGKRATKTVAMRTRKRVTMASSMRYAAMTTGLAAMLASGHAETPGGQQLGEILPQSDRALAECVDEARCAWLELQAAFQQIVAASGRKHALDESELAQVRSRVDALKTKMDQLRATLDSQASSLSFSALDDPKLAAQLLRCLEKNVASARKRVEKMQKRLASSSKPVKAGPLEKSARLGEDTLREALFNLVVKTKRSKKARKQTMGLPSAVSASRFADDNESGTRRSATKRDSKRSKKSSKKAAKKAAKKTVRKSSAGPGAKAEKNTYLALAATGKVDEADAYYFETLPLELSGDVVAQVDVGLFSSSAKVLAAAGDGEQGCLEVSTVGSAPAAAFVSLCGRQNAQRGGFEAYMLTPQGARSVTFLPGVEIAELRVLIQDGSVTYEIRDAEERGAWTLVDAVTKPADPLTISLGASLLGTGDEVGFDNLSVEALRAD